MRRWAEIGRPTRGRVRSVSVQFGWGAVWSDAWLDTGYAGSRFEFTFHVGVGPWRFQFDWRPA